MCSATPASDRSEIPLKAYEILTDEGEMLAELIVPENGKSWADAMGEAVCAKEFFR